MEETKNDLKVACAQLREKFAAVEKLLDTYDKCIVETEQYKAKYEAIDIYKEIETIITSSIEALPENEVRDEHVLLATINLYSGLLHVHTQELKAGEEGFMKCIEILKDRELEPGAVIPVISALNQLGIIWSQWSEPSKSKTFLEQAEQIYNDFTGPDSPCRVPYHMFVKYGIKKLEVSPEVALEKLHILTLYYLAQVYGSLKDHHKSAVYCHMTLQRQLGETNIEDLDYIDWALNAATLSQYFMKNDGFSQARHHLAAASHILQKYEDTLKKRKTENSNESEILAADYEKLKHRSADVAMCWAKYGLLLLKLSKRRLLDRSEKDGDSQLENSNLKAINELKFDILEKELEPIINQITNKYLLDFDDARAVFLNIQKWLDEAKTYYTLENHASDYVLIAQDLSQAYRYLAFFEEHEDRQAKMHKRRIDILENVIKELNPQYYKSACRQIWGELGDIYSDILSIKLDRLDGTNETPTAHALTKINHLARSAIKNFQLFLDSLDTSSSNGDMKQFPEDVVKPALLSYIHIGRLHLKIITPDKTVQIENTQNSINAYQFVIDYCEKYPDMANVMKDKIYHINDLLSLLKMKLSLLKKETTE